MSEIIPDTLESQYFFGSFSKSKKASSFWLFGFAVNKDIGLKVKFAAECSEAAKK